MSVVGISSLGGDAAHAHGVMKRRKLPHTYAAFGLVCPGRAVYILKECTKFAAEWTFPEYVHRSLLVDSYFARLGVRLPGA
jgi:hypothetical protein